MISSRAIVAVAAACFSLATTTVWGFGLDGDEVQGSLILPWAPEGGNWFSVGANGSPTSGVPSSAIVGAGAEFGFYPSSSSLTWSVTANISDSRITINRSISDPSPVYWILQLSSWTLTLSGLDWAGTPGISSAVVVSQDPNITLLGFDAHSVQFRITDMTIYPEDRPLSFSQTTIIQLAAVPEPSAWALFGIGAGFLLIKWWRIRSRQSK
jgi:hypothetical protein